MDAAALLKTFAPNATLLRSWPLTGGVWAVVTALELAQQGQKRRLVVRQYGARDLAENADIAGAEFKLLHFLHRSDLPVPEPLHHQPGVLVLAFIEGESGVDVTPDPAQMAHFLARLHTLQAPAQDIRRLPDVGPAPQQPDDSLFETRIREGLSRFAPPPPATPALLHGDFWPGNTLWQAGDLAAVLDWEDASQGHPLYDLGIARLELLFFYGQEAMRALTNEYVRRTDADLTTLPYWDLRASLRPCGFMGYWGLAPELEARMRVRHSWFVEEALRMLDA